MLWVRHETLMWYTTCCSAARFARPVRKKSVSSELSIYEYRVCGKHLVSRNIECYFEPAIRIPIVIVLTNNILTRKHEILPKRNPNAQKKKKKLKCILYQNHSHYYNN